MECLWGEAVSGNLIKPRKTSKRKQIENNEDTKNAGCMLSCFSHVWLFVTLWSVAHQTPLSMGFSRREYWIALLYPPPGDLPDPGTEPTSLTSPELAGGFFTTGTTWEACLLIFKFQQVFIDCLLNHRAHHANCWSWHKKVCPYSWEKWTLCLWTD